MAVNTPIYTALVMAAGSGTRMHSTVKKQFADLCGMPVVGYSLRAFEENVKLQSFCLANGMSEKIMQLDDEFHRAFYAIAHKMEIYRLMQNMAIHFDRVRNMALYSVSEIKIVQDHEAILEAIREQNGEMAGSLLKKHLNRYRIDAGAIKERFPEFF